MRSLLVFGALLLYRKILVLDPHDFWAWLCSSRSRIICFSCFWEFAAIPLPPVFLPLTPRQTDLYKYDFLVAYKAFLILNSRNLGGDPIAQWFTFVFTVYSHLYSQSMHICNLPKAHIFSSSRSVCSCYLGLCGITQQQQIGLLTEQK